MNVEVSALFASIVLGVVQLLVATHAGTLQRGFKWNLGSRDQKAPELTGAAGRLDRAFRNFMETFPFFATAVLLVQVLGRNSAFSALGAQIYVIARVIYVPVYAAGVVGLRSLIWLTSFVGIALVLVSIVST